MFFFLFSGSFGKAPASASFASARSLRLIRFASLGLQAVGAWLALPFLWTKVEDFENPCAEAGSRDVAAWSRMISGGFWWEPLIYPLEARGVQTTNPCSQLSGSLAAFMLLSWVRGGVHATS